MKTNSIGFVSNFWIFWILVVVIFKLERHQCIVVELNDSNFAQVVVSRPFTMVVFYTDWCHHCHDLLPELDISDEFLVQNRIHAIAKVNCEYEGRETCDAMKIDSFPTVYTMLYGKVVERYKNEYKAKNITDYILSKLMGILGSNPIASTPASPYSYLPNYDQPQQPYVWQQNFQPPVFNVGRPPKPSPESWADYFFFNYKPYTDNFRETNNYMMPQGYRNYDRFWPNPAINYQNYPSPFGPSFGVDNALYEQSMKYVYDTLGYGQSYRNEDYSKPTPLSSSSNQNPRQYLDSITSGMSGGNLQPIQNIDSWFNSNQNLPPLSKFPDFSQPNSGWPDLTGLKKHKVVSPTQTDKNSKADDDWIWNPDFDLGHRPAVRQYMVPSKYRKNAIKSAYLKNILHKYLNDKNYQRRHSIPFVSSNKNLPPFKDPSTDDVHSTENSDAMKLVVDALKKIAQL